ncbi:MAG: PIN domain-containing protein [Actinomycetota bacterium]|nr:PIN domain-containing protein [Actinomycetota bacterium]
MTLVVDASAVIDLLVRSVRGDRVRGFLAERADEDMATVAHLDAEVFSGLARIHRAGHLDADHVAELLGRLGDLAVTRLPITTALLRAAWRLRDTISARDSLYVAAAAALSAGLITTDERLARAVPDLAVDLEGDRP